MAILIIDNHADKLHHHLSKFLDRHRKVTKMPSPVQWKPHQHSLSHLLHHPKGLHLDDHSYTTTTVAMRVDQQAVAIVGPIFNLWQQLCHQWILRMGSMFVQYGTLTGYHPCFRVSRQEFCHNPIPRPRLRAHESPRRPLQEDHDVPRSDK